MPNIQNYLKSIGDEQKEKDIVKIIDDQNWVIEKTDQALKTLYGELKKANAKVQEEKRLLEQKVRKRTEELAKKNKTLKTEIKKRRSAEKALKKSEYSFRNLIAEYTDGILVIDEEGIIRFVNPAAEALLNKAKDQLIGSSFGYPIQQDEKTILELCSDHKKIIISEMQVVKINWHDNPAYLVALKDISDLKNAETEVRQQNLFLQTLLDTIPNPIFYKDLKGLYLGCNQAFENAVGINKKKILGKTVYDIASKEMADTYFQADQQLYEQKNVQVYENQVKYADGKIHDVLFYKAVFKSSDGTPAGIVGVMIDITERKELEEKFFQAQKMEAVGRLAGGIAHDFNNLLTIINGYADFILDDLSNNDPIKEDIQEIKEAGRRASDLTRHLLIFSRKQIMEVSVFNINEVVDSLQKMLGRIIGEDIQLTILKANDLWRIKADIGQIEQVIINLVVNARDAMPKGGQLTIKTHNSEITTTQGSICPGKYVQLIVSDTGVGIEKNKQKFIFDPFYTTKEKGKGSGLGLSTVFGIVQQCEGYIFVESEIKKGTSFKLYFPICEDSETNNSQIEKPEVVIGGSETILVVDDNKNILEMAKRTLERFGYSCIAVSGVKEALNVLDKHPKSIDLILTDVVMPEFSGRDLAEMIKPLLPNIKILYMSGYTDDAIVHHGVLHSEMTFIQKPFSPEKLALKVREILDKNVD